MQDLTLGKPAKAQLAKPVRSPEEAYQLMKGKHFVVETKFDGAPAFTFSSCCVLSVWLCPTCVAPM